MANPIGDDMKKLELYASFAKSVGCQVRELLEKLDRERDELTVRVGRVSPDRT